MHEFAATIKSRLGALTTEYAQRLAQIDEYARLAGKVRRQIALEDLNLIATCLENKDDSPFVEFTHARAGERVEQGFTTEPLMQALNALEETLQPMVTRVGVAKFIWRMMTQARESVALQTAKRLRESESKFRQIISGSTVGIFRTTVDGRIVEANPALLATLRLDSVEQANQIGLRNMYEDTAERQRLLGMVRRGPVSGFETRFRRADGQVITISVGAHLICDEQGEPVFLEGTLEDITERKAAQETLEEQRMFLRQIIDINPNFVFVRDRQGRFVLANRAIAQAYGTTVEDLIGKTDADFNPDPGAIARIRQDDRQVMDSRREKVISETAIVDPDGSSRWVQTIKRPLVDADGVARRVLGVSSDITERKKAEQAFETQHAFLRQIIDINPNFVFVRDREGRFVLANRATAAGYGVGVEELIGKTDADFNPNEEQVRRAHQDDLQVMDSLREKRVSEAAITDPDGNVRWLQTIKRPLIDEDGVARRILGVSSDITEQKRLREQLATLLERRAEQVRTSTQIAQEIAAAPALDELFHRVVTLIKERFDYYHAQFFRYEPALDAVVLVTGYGEIGERMLAEGYRSKMGLDVVGTAVATGEPVLISDVTRDANWVANSYLPNTKGELAVPVKLHDQVLGILDVHSDSAGALTEDDQILLEGLCGQIAIAIQDTRLRQEMAESLQELRSMYRALGREGWRTFRQGAELPGGYVYDQTDIQPADDLWSPEIGAAVERQVLVSSTPDDQAAGEHGSMAVVPMQVHDEVIGVLGVYDDPQYSLSSEDLALIEAVSEQTALALESARLFEEARTRAEDLSMHFRVSQQLASAFLQPDEIGEIVAGHLTQMGRLECSFSLLQDDGGTLKVVADFYVADEELGLCHERGVPDYKLSDYPATAWVMETLQPLIVQADDLQADLAELAYMREHKVETLLIVPMIVKGQAIGVMEVEWWEKQSIIPERLNLMVTLASQAAVALENARLFEDARARAEEQTVLSEMGRALSAALDEAAILESIYQHTSRLMDASNFYVALYDSETEEVTFPLALENGERVQWRPRQLSKGLTEHVIRGREPVLIREDVDGWLEEQGIASIGIQTQSWLGVPIMLGQQVLGIITVQDHTTPQLYGEHHRELLNSVAVQAAIALQNARLFENVRARAEELTALNDLSRALSSTLSAEEVLEAVYQGASRLLDTSVFYISFYHPGTDEIEFPFKILDRERAEPEGIQPATGLTAHLVRTRQPLLLRDKQRKAATAELGVELVPLQPVARESECWLGVPMLVGEQVLGTMALLSYTDPRAFGERDQELLTAIAGQAAIALQNARLFEQARARAWREQQLREITTRLRTPPDVDGVLRALAQELGQVLGRRTFVRLGSQADSNTSESLPGDQNPNRDDGGGL